MVASVLGVIVGLAILTYAADHFVIGAARISARLQISPIVVGAIVIGFGTSAPEMVVSGLAAASGSIDLAAGNIVGSSIANLTLVLGIAALITPIAVRSPVLKREAPLALVATVAFAWVAQSSATIVEGVLLAGLLAAAVTLIVVASRRGDPVLSEQVDEFLPTEQPALPRETLRTIVGLLAVLGAAQLLVVNATSIAEQLGLAEGFIGMTVVAVGTSLPELATAVQAARRRETDLLVGNLLGSNLFNAAAVGAITVFLGSGQQIDSTIAQTGSILMITITVLVVGFMITGRRLVRWEAIVLLLAYLATLPLIA